MKITYLYHSGFSVELDSCMLIFDYYKGNIPAVPLNKPVYFFASHKHQDHFNMNVLNMLPLNNPTFILSNDIRLSPKYLERYGYNCDIKEKIVSAKKNDDFILDDLRIRTYKSTDCGCAFIVTCEGINIYHAGDLNLWCFEENDDIVNKMQERIYAEQLNKMKDISVDIAFIPLDPRLADNFYCGMLAFLENVNVKKIYPMHMWDRYEIIKELIDLPAMTKYKTKIVVVDDENKEWIY